MKKPTGWKSPFDEPIPLPRGRQLVTLEDAGRCIKKLPKAEHEAGCGMLREPNDAKAKEKHRRLEFPKHVDGEIVGSNLAIAVGPNAIHLIALDTQDGHQWLP